MKKETYEKILKKTIDTIISHNVNSACWFVFHQPTLPNKAVKFKKK